MSGLLSGPPEKPGYVLENRAGMIPIPQWYWSFGSQDDVTIALEWHGPYLLKGSAEKAAQMALRGKGS